MKSTFAAILRLAPTGLLAGLLAFVLGSSASNTYAAGPYPWSDQPEYQSDYQKSQDEQFNERTRQNQRDWEREQEQYRQESLRQERERSSNSAKPVDPNPYNFPEAVYGPNGRMILCTKGFNATYCN